MNTTHCKSKQNLCAFLDPTVLSWLNVENAPEVAMDYLCGAMLQATKAKKRFLLLPYHQMLVLTL